MLRKPWSWGETDAVLESHDLGQLSSDSDDSDNSGKKGFLTSSDTEDDIMTVCSKPSSVSEVLQLLGCTDIDPENIPVLCVPEPIGFLISEGKWKELLILTRWHKNCLMSSGVDLRGTPLPGLVDFPLQNSSVWADAGEHVQSTHSEFEEIGATEPKRGLAKGITSLLFQIGRLH